MKFWQKIFISMFLIFLIAFDVGVFFITSYSYQFSLQRETESSVREQELILSSVQNSICNAESIFSGSSQDDARLTAVIQPMAEYYKKQGVFLALYNDRKLIYSDTPDVDAQLLSLKTETDKNILNETNNNVRYLFIASKVAAYPNLTFIYVRDVRLLDTYVYNITRVFVVLNIVVCLFLGLTVYFILRHMTRPIRQLNSTTSGIADGAYDKRVSIKSNDELGELAKTFNRMADAVEKNIDSLKKAAEDRQEFINDLSHEMRTPLTSVLGYSEYLQKANSSEEERLIAAGNLHLSAEQLSNLSKKLMDVTFLSSRKITKEEINIAALFEKLKDLMALPLLERKVTLQTEVNAVAVWGDESLLLSLLANLVENAAKASQAGQVVTVCAMEKGKTVIEVSDTGRGMTPDVTEKITEPFYRVDKSRSRSEGGVGLGLAICKKIVDLHGAKLAFISKVGVGTTVRVEFTTP